MKSKISDILSEIDNKKQELKNEYLKLKDKYWFKIINKKIIFNKDVIKENKKYKKSILDSIFTVEVRELLSIPFIYAMIIPALFLDIFLVIYQNIAFRLYWIPLVKRKDYFEFDRKELDYLNLIQKFNCLYCSYVNWLFSYATEIWWKTEKYWCPIKHARKMKTYHSWQKDFADYWDASGFKTEYWNNKTFK